MINLMSCHSSKDKGANKNPVVAHTTYLSSELYPMFEELAKQVCYGDRMKNPS